MAEDTRQFIPFLQSLDLFSGLTGVEMEDIAAGFTLTSIKVGEPLFSGRTPEDDFYIIRSGSITVQYGKEGETPRVLTVGEHFTELDLLYGQPDTAVITTTGESADLLHLDENAFYNLLAKYPKLKPRLARTREAQLIIERQGFDWVGRDEVIYFLARKHEAILLFNLIGPFIAFGIASAAIFWVATNAAASLWTTGVVCSGLFALGALLWGVWNFIDWGNDFYIVTNQRAVWVEKVIWLYESRDEAPLNTILSVNTSSTFLGRILGYGTVVVRTFTGEITFRNLPLPGRMAAILEEYRRRLETGSERLEKRRIDEAMRERIWQEKPPADGDQKAGTTAHPVVKPGPLQRIFGNFFTMRFEVGDVITYRKYWPTLIAKTWIPALFALLVLVVIVLLANGFRLGSVTLGLLETAITIGSLLILFVFFPWWLYKYVDWRNDIYQLTDKYIFDIERKPLGTEIKKSAPLENILSLEHERKGFLGYILNYGYVTINVGETQFEFRDVHEPARVQQDIFNRIHAQRRQVELAEAAKDRQHLVDVIEIYHHNAEEYREDDIFDDFDQDFGVELGSDGYP